MEMVFLRACFLFFLLTLYTSLAAQPAPVHFRVNQVGYRPGESKVAVVFSEQSLGPNFQVVDLLGGEVVLEGRLRPAPAPGWQRQLHYFEADFSRLDKPGRYALQTEGGDFRSAPFDVSAKAYHPYTDDLLVFMQQQRCGYNPFLDMVCHQRDGRTFYGPMPDSTYVDASGGWHDAGDQLKYLITGSFATASMLYAYELYPEAFSDKVNALGQSGANGLADVLDEARWGLDWIHRLHGSPDWLIHQVADDRDHRGWKWPDQDPSDFGWGPNSYRAAYVANGQPQGLNKYFSKATGVANLAGRSAAAMAIAYRIWRDQVRDTAYAAKCLAAARTLYELGRQKPGYQQGNSYGAPYRYNEDTWTDDMEWGAAELYAATGEAHYLAEAKTYARLTNTATSWMALDTADHYRLYPFINMGHFALFPHVDKGFQDTLAGYYRQGIEDCLKKGEKNVYRIGVPFIWCSNNLVTALMSQIIFYERMTGDRRYHDFLLAQRDWLLGRNPWGTTMFTGIPRDGEYPLDVHTSVWKLTGEMVPGGLVDGPVYAKIYKQLIGLTLNEPDEFAAFQNDYVVYHDDIGDYSTNEPTMDGTAGAILPVAYFVSGED